MQQTISKSQFKTQLLQYLRSVEQTKQSLVITHGGKPVVEIIPYKGKPLLSSLAGTVLEYKNPSEYTNFVNPFPLKVLL